MTRPQLGRAPPSVLHASERVAASASSLAASHVNIGPVSFVPSLTQLVDPQLPAAEGPPRAPRLTPLDSLISSHGPPKVQPLACRVGCPGERCIVRHPLLIRLDRRSQVLSKTACGFRSAHPSHSQVLLTPGWTGGRIDARADSDMVIEVLATDAFWGARRPRVWLKSRVELPSFLYRLIQRISKRLTHSAVSNSDVK